MTELFATGNTEDMFYKVMDFWDDPEIVQWFRSRGYMLYNHIYFEDRPARHINGSSNSIWRSYSSQLSWCTLQCTSIYGKESAASCPRSFGESGKYFNPFAFLNNILLQSLGKSGVCTRFRTAACRYKAGSRRQWRVSHSLLSVRARIRHAQRKLHNPYIRLGIIQRFLVGSHAEVSLGSYLCARYHLLIQARQDGASLLRNQRTISYAKFFISYIRCSR